MSGINIALKKDKIGGGRYEEYVWLNKKCYSIFKDGDGDYAVAVDSTNLRVNIPTKTEALQILKDKIISEGRYGA